MKLQRSSSVIVLAETNSLIKELKQSKEELNSLEVDFMNKKVFKQKIIEDKKDAQRKIKYYEESMTFKKYLTIINLNKNLGLQIDNCEADLSLLNVRVFECKKKITNCVDNLCNKKEASSLINEI